MPRRLQIAVVGYGIAGICAAIFLRGDGHEVTHFESSAVPGFGGAGLLLNAAGLEVITRLGLRDAAMSRGAIVSRVYGETVSGSKVLDLRYEDDFDGNFGLGIQRAVLYGLLHAADKHAGNLQTSRAIIAVDAEKGYLFNQHQERLGPFDLVIAADGANSRIRRGLSSLVQRDRPYPWGAVVCLLDDQNDVGRNQLLQSFAGVRHLSMWPVGSRGPGSPRRLNVSINVPVNRLESLRRPEIWKGHIEKHFSYITSLLDQSILAPDLLSFTYRDVVLRRYFDSRVVLIGDAAHCMSPQLGQGANMGLQDGWLLAQSLQRQDLRLALQEFDRERRRQMHRYQLISRFLTPMFQSGSRALALLRDSTFYQLSKAPFAKDLMLKTLSGYGAAAEISSHSQRR